MFNYIICKGFSIEEGVFKIKIEKYLTLSVDEGNTSPFWTKVESGKVIQNILLFNYEFCLGVRIVETNIFKRNLCRWVHVYGLITKKMLDDDHKQCVFRKMWSFDDAKKVYNIMVKIRLLPSVVKFNRLLRLVSEMNKNGVGGFRLFQWLCVFCHREEVRSIKHHRVVLLCTSLWLTCCR